MASRAGLAAVARAKASLRPLREPDGWPGIADYTPSPAGRACADRTNGGCIAAPPIAAADAEALTAQQFQEQYEAVGRPALLRGLLAHWPAASGSSWRAWTLDNLLRRLGNHPVQCGDDADGENVELPFKAFVLDYVHRCPDRNPMLVFDSVILQRGAIDEPLVNTLGPKRDSVRQLSPEPEPEIRDTWTDLCDDYTTPVIFAHDDYLSELGELSRPPYRWILVAPARSGSFIHTDPMATHAWNALLVGVKRWVMFHPSTPAELLAPWAGKFKRLDPACRPEAGEQGECEDDWEDLWGWFVEDLPAIKQSVAAYFSTRPPRSTDITAVGGETKSIREDWWYRDFLQHEGEIVYVPSMWHHAVLNLCDTVAVTQNYCSRTNLRQCYASATGVELIAPERPHNDTQDSDERRHDTSSRVTPGLCSQLQRQWRETMQERHPQMAAAHMPAEWLRAVGADDL